MGLSLQTITTLRRPTTTYDSSRKVCNLEELVHPSITQVRRCLLLKHLVHHTQGQLLLKASKIKD